MLILFELKMCSNHLVFLKLLKAGLWCKGNPDVRIDEPTDWYEVYRLASEQSVPGLVLAGLEHSNVKPPKEMLLQWIGEVQLIELRNKEMNAFVADLIEKLRRSDIYAILIKGQGVAQCYEKPLWRASGDVDLLLSDGNYQKATEKLKPLSTFVGEENSYNRHLAMKVDGWSVELHGTLRGGLWKKLDKEIDNVQNDVFCRGRVRSWMNGQTQVFLPAAEEDVFFVFAHILQHYYQEGIGLRQICDWCRVLWTYRKHIDISLLEKRLESAKIMNEWKAFGVFAVVYLEMPQEAMPFYSPTRKWRRKAECVMTFIMETGNFGHNRDYSYQEKYSYFSFKTISLWRHIVDFYKYFNVFPQNAVKVAGSMLIRGFRQIGKEI